MERIPKTNYAILSDVYERISQREKDAAKLPHGETRQAILKEIAQLRFYAELRLAAGNGVTGRLTWRPSHVLIPCA